MIIPLRACAKRARPAHLIHNIENERNTICIVSWQEPNTLGRRLVEGAAKARIFGDEVPVRAEVATVNGLSAHAGQDFLIKYAEQANSLDLQGVYLVHGDNDAAAVLRRNFRAGIRKVRYPARRRSLTFNQAIRTSPPCPIEPPSLI